MARHAVQSDRDAREIPLNEIRSIPSQLIRVDCIVKNKWNPNSQDDETFGYEKSVITEFGFIDPCVVRVHPTLKGQFEIIDGEHRWRAAGELHIEEIPCINLGVISDARAKALTDILNNLKGEQDQSQRARLLKSVIETDPTLRAALPYGNDDLQAILANASFDWDSLQKPSKTKKPAGEGVSGWVGLKVSMKPEQHTIVRATLDRVKAQFQVESDAEALFIVCKSVLK